MPWPQLTDYQEAIQAPRRCFADPELRQGTPLLDGLGLPRPVTGGFASVYQIASGGRRFAVRCFNRPAPDVAQRYHLIDQHLRAANLPATVLFEYLARGIQVRGEWYPVLKMEWIDGDPLHLYLARHLDRPWAIRLLAHQFAHLCADLARHGIAHGDLQHGNILVVDGALRLIDYDGMYVPALAGLPSQELGHRNYQHPRRDARDFGPHLDHFAAWVIYSSLIALSLEPALWRDLQAGDECLLLRREDFDRPATSAALAAMSGQTDPSVTRLATALRALLDVDDLTRLPPLAQAIAAPVTAARGPAPRPEWARPEYLSASAPASLAPATDVLIDVLAVAGPVEVAAADPSERAVMVLAVLVAVVAALSVAGGRLPLVLAAALSGSFALAALAALTWRYHQRGEVARKRGLRAEVRDLARSVSHLERRLARLAAALDGVSRDENRALARLTPKLQAVDQRQATELARIGKRLKTVTDHIDGERQRLTAAEATEEAQALRRWHDQLVDQRLGRLWVMTAPIAGLGVGLKARLLAAGIHSAADIVHVRAQVGGDSVEIVVRGIGPVRVAGVGPTRAAALAAWRRGQEAEARASLPTTLPPAQRNALRARYASRRSALDARRAAAVTQAQAGGDRVRLTVGRQRGALEQQVTAVRERHGRERQRLERDQAEARQLLAEQQERTTIVRGELATYQAVTVRAYVRQLVWLSHGA